MNIEDVREPAFRIAVLAGRAAVIFAEGSAMARLYG